MERLHDLLIIKIIILQELEIQTLRSWDLVVRSPLLALVSQILVWDTWKARAGCTALAEVNPTDVAASEHRTGWKELLAAITGPALGVPVCCEALKSSRWESLFPALRLNYTDSQVHAEDHPRHDCPKLIVLPWAKRSCPRCWQSLAR